MAEATPVRIWDRAHNVKIAPIRCINKYKALYKVNNNTNKCGLGLVGYDICFTRRRSRVRFSEPVIHKKYMQIHANTLKRKRLNNNVKRSVKHS